MAEYGPSTKLGATVAGQTSVKAPEKEAFERHLPKDVDIVSVHSLHGPTVTTEGQPLVRPLYISILSPSLLFQFREAESVLMELRSLYIIEDPRRRFGW